MVAQTAITILVLAAAFAETYKTMLSSLSGGPSMIRRFAIALAISAGTASTLFAAGQGPNSTAAGYICAHVPSAVLAAACQYFGFCC